MKNNEYLRLLKRLLFLLFIFLLKVLKAIRRSRHLLDFLCESRNMVGQFKKKIE